MKKKVLFFGALLLGFVLIFVLYDMMTRTTPPWRKRKKQDPQKEVVLPKIMYFADTQVVVLPNTQKISWEQAAQLARLSIDDLKKYNISIEDSIRLPVRALHTVSSNENLESIAQNYKVSPQNILDQDGKQLTTISQGQQVIILKP